MSYLDELNQRRQRLSDGMAALSAVSMPSTDRADQRSALDVLATARRILDEQIAAESRPKGPAAIEFLTGPNAGRDEPYAGTVSREDWADHKAAEVTTHFGTQVDPRPLIAAALRDAYARGYGVAAVAS
jgi:hypothetical protein